MALFFDFSPASILVFPYPLFFFLSSLPILALRRKISARRAAILLLILASCLIRRHFVVQGQTRLLLPSLSTVSHMHLPHVPSGSRPGRQRAAQRVWFMQSHVYLFFPFSFFGAAGFGEPFSSATDLDPTVTMQVLRVETTRARIFHVVSAHVTFRPLLLHFPLRLVVRPWTLTEGQRLARRKKNCTLIARPAHRAGMVFSRVANRCWNCAQQRAFISHFYFSQPFSHRRAAGLRARSQLASPSASPLFASFLSKSMQSPGSDFSPSQFLAVKFQRRTEDDEVR